MGPCCAEPQHCWCQGCRDAPPETSAPQNYLRKGTKTFVRTEQREASSSGNNRGAGNVQAWRLKALEKALEVHAELNQRLGITFLSLGDAIQAAWATRDPVTGDRLLQGEPLRVCERVQRRANAARHQAVGGQGLSPEPVYGRWGEQSRRRFEQRRWDRGDLLWGEGA